MIHDHFAKPTSKEFNLTALTMTEIIPRGVNIELLPLSTLPACGPN